MLQLASAVSEWDEEYRRNPNPKWDDASPYQTVLRQIQALAPLRYQPYRNEPNPRYVDRLRYWLTQIPEDHQRFAFMIAAQVLFVSLRQFESLQRHLFERQIRRALLQHVVEREGLGAWDYQAAIPFFDSEMDSTLFVANSDSSAINSFIHVNSAFFPNYGRRNLVGPPAEFWTYPAVRKVCDQDPTVRAAAAEFEALVLSTDPRFGDKRRLVVVEDFAGTGSDLLKTVRWVRESSLPFSDVWIAPVVATEHALGRLTASCAHHTDGTRRFRGFHALQIPDRWRCFGTAEPYLNEGPLEDLSERCRKLVEWHASNHLAGVPDPPPKNGFGELALAVVLHSNCPDNSLPVLWKHTRTWRTLFRRVSRYI